MAKYIFTTGLTFSTLITIQQSSSVFVQAADFTKTEGNSFDVQTDFDENGEFM